MPKISGLRLVESLQQSFPDLKAVFMSGYAAELLSRRNLLPSNAVFVEKPFGKETLLATVHQALPGSIQSC
jgi:two-component system cell cycle sensor histidine kinase/response regulator CckA